MLRVAIFSKTNYSCAARILNELSNRGSIFLLCGNASGNHPTQVCNRGGFLYKWDLIKRRKTLRAMARMQFW
ncbi:MAG: hypothetical protein JWQ49_4431 [Edaphobacter sp.]|nr:hypothetical protein [Edaphobacter sp.]